MKQLLLILLFALFSLHSSAQPRVIKFPELESLMKGNSDSTFVINFWATWCKPCVAELPNFETLAKNYSDKKLKVVLVSLDFKRELNTRLIPFVKDNAITSPVLLIDEPDYNSWLDKVDTSWSGAIPATLIIDENHRKHFYEKEFTSYLELENIVKPLIK